MSIRIKHARRRIALLFTAAAERIRPPAEEKTWQKEGRRVYEERHTTPYATFRSWEDDLARRGDAAGPVVHLFEKDTGNVFKMSGPPGPYSSQDHNVHFWRGMSVDVEASDQGILDHVARGTIVRTMIDCMEQTATPLGRLMQAPLVLDRSFPLVPRQPFYVQLDFDPSTFGLLKDLRTRVGPGAGWVWIRVNLDVLQRRFYL